MHIRDIVLIYLLGWRQGGRGATRSVDASISNFRSLRELASIGSVH